MKRRYIEEYSSQKLFEIYEMDDCYFNDEQRKAFIDCIDDEIEKHDMVVVADYGHGLLDSSSIDKIEDKAKFLAVNTQANAVTTVSIVFPNTRKPTMSVLLTASCN